MNELEKHIKVAESRWLDELSCFCKNLFAGKQLISHDYTHHLRVWHYASEILFSLSKKIDISYELLESCLIASLFHDTGLTVTLDESHGHESSKICFNYFEQNKLQMPGYFKGLLYAIEKHDDKNYKENINAPASLFSILCTADDLDAFGNIGIVRYTEIYLLRGIEIHSLAKPVIENLDKRFFNFENVYQGFPELYKKHKARYLITRTFFENLIKEF